MKSILDSVIEDGVVVPSKMATYFHTNLKEIGNLTGVSHSVLSRTSRFANNKNQEKLRAVTEIINRILPWSQSIYHAYAWYRSEQLPSFGGLTPEQLVKDGRADALRKHLDRASMGGYA